VRPLVLPGDMVTWIEAPIYAQVSFCVSHRYKGYGAQVKVGDLLADIGTPDLDQQLLQAKQDLNTAITDGQLADVTAKLWKALLSSASVLQQSVDEKAADAVAQRAAQ
jgi:hypothetical protein